MSDAHEPSYYEIALTNRQVLTAFVVMLLMLLAVFVAGVWLGRGAAPEPVPDAERVAEAAPGDLEQIEEFTFPSDEPQASSEGVSPPDLGEVRRPERQRPDRGPSSLQRARTLAEDVGAATAQEVSPAARDTPPAEASPPPAVAPPPSSPPPPPPTRTAPSPTVGSFVIQVFSSKDEAQAKKVLQQLVAGGHQAFLSPVEVGSLTMFRVRIGPFGDRGAAETAATRVRSAYKLDTWITAAEP